MLAIVGPYRHEPGEYLLVELEREDGDQHRAFNSFQRAEGKVSTITNFSGVKVHYTNLRMRIEFPVAIVFNFLAAFSGLLGSGWAVLLKHPRWCLSSSRLG